MNQNVGENGQVKASVSEFPQLLQMPDDDLEVLRVAGPKIRREHEEAQVYVPLAAHCLVLAPLAHGVTSPERCVDRSGP